MSLPGDRTTRATGLADVLFRSRAIAREGRASPFGVRCDLSITIGARLASGLTVSRSPGYHSPALLRQDWMPAYLRAVGLSAVGSWAFDKGLSDRAMR